MRLEPHHFIKKVPPLKSYAKNVLSKEEDYENQRKNKENG
jgi:hypothetical protein